MLPHDEPEIMQEMLEEADPEGLYLCALGRYPYMMTPDQISEFTGISSQGVRKILSKGGMLGCQVGNRWLVPKLSLLRYLNSSCTTSKSEKEAANGEVDMRQAL